MSAKRRDPAWVPADYELRDIDAMRALAAGEASKQEQIRALDWIIKNAAGTYDISFRSDADGGDRDTSFAEGRRFVGLQVVKLINMPTNIVAAMRKQVTERKGKEDG